MGSFQITYDDFSGGQYMGRKSSNWPKNTWLGENVMCTPDGNLMPSQPLELSRYQKGVTSTYAEIYDHWVIDDVSYVFTRWGTTVQSGTMTRQSSVWNGTTAPYTPTVTDLVYAATNVPTMGAVAYAQPPGNVSSFFYFAGSLGDIYRISPTSGTITQVSTVLNGLIGTGTSAGIALYGYRLIAWGSSKFLYYSNTDIVTWSATQYYEFNSSILNVVVRTNDLLVITYGGVYSVVGTLGVSVTIQLIVPELNVAGGMADAFAVNRNAYFIDEVGSGVGRFSGRIHALVGSSVETPYQILASDTTETSQRSTPYDAAVLGAGSNGRLILQLVNGFCYIETTPGQWARYYSSRLNYATVGGSRQMMIGKPASLSPNDFSLVASISTASPFTSGDRGLVLTRYLNNIPDIENIDSGMRTSYLGTQAPTGTATLPEYWHSKPFTVKEVFVEFFARTSYTPAITVGITPTGIIDLYGVDNGGTLVEASEPLTVGTANTNSASITQRYHVNNAAKGFGATPYLTISNATIKRVILNCED